MDKNNKINGEKIMEFINGQRARARSKDLSAPIFENRAASARFDAVMAMDYCHWWRFSLDPAAHLERELESICGRIQDGRAIGGVVGRMRSLYGKVSDTSLVEGILAARAAVLTVLAGQQKRIDAPAAVQWARRERIRRALRRAAVRAAVKSLTNDFSGGQTGANGAKRALKRQSIAAIERMEAKKSDKRPRLSRGKAARIASAIRAIQRRRTWGALPCNRPQIIRRYRRIIKVFKALRAGESLEIAVEAGGYTWLEQKKRSDSFSIALQRAGLQEIKAYLQ